MRPTTTILITTKDRKDELQRALESAVSQAEVDEIFVFDDGSSDGTETMVRSQFPSVRYERSATSLGIVAARNYAIARSTGSVIITIDDDCVFQSQSTVQRTLNDLVADRRIGAVAIPHINVNQSRAVHSSAPRQDPTFVMSQFTGCASALNRDLFLRLGGFDPVLWRQGEEYDFCTRLLDKGYVTRCGTAPPILHYESPKRTKDAIVYHMARGRLTYAWRNVPLPALPLHAAATAALSLADGCKVRCFKVAALGLLSAMFAILCSKVSRSPVSMRTYRLVRRLRKHGPVELSLLAPLLPKYPQ